MKGMTVLHKYFEKNEGGALSARREGWWRRIIRVELASDLVKHRSLLCLGVDDVNKFWFKGSSAHEEAIDIFLGGEFFAGSAGHRTWKAASMLENIITIICALTQQPTDLHRWFSQSWPQPRTRCSSATPSASRELPEPEAMGITMKDTLAVISTSQTCPVWISTCCGEAVLPVPMAHTGS